MNVRRIRVINGAALARAYAGFSAGEHRLLLLFRHVDLADGPLVLTTVSALLPRIARDAGIRLPKRPHTHFLYGRDVLNWAGAAARWAFPRTGGIPVQNGRVDREAQAWMRQIAAHGEYPLALAPEAQVTYRMDRCSELAGGTAHLARWVLQETQGKLPVLLLPIGIRYTDPLGPDEAVRESLEEIGVALGLRVPRSGQLRDDVLACLDSVLGAIEDAYRAFGSLPPASEGLSPGERITLLMDAILAQVEAVLGLSGAGSTVQRLFAFRYRIMDLQYPPHTSLDSLSAGGRAWLDLLAAQAHLLDRHEQIVDVLLYLDPDYIPPDAPPQRLAEYARNLRDLVNRFTGGTIDTRHRPRRRSATIHIGEPLDARPSLVRDNAGKGGIRALTLAVREALQQVSAP